MSHFTIGVITPKDCADIEYEIERLLAPFDENMEVDPYPRECYCINEIAERAGTERANRLVGTIEYFREKVCALPESEKDDYWWHHIGLWQETRQDAIDYDPMHAQPDPECDECGGTGIYMSTRNPLSKWDWWRVGGRWDGKLVQNPRESENGFNFAKHHEQAINNRVRVGELLERSELFTFYAVVSPDGQWHGRGRMGWFGMTSEDKNDGEWGQESRALYAQYVDCDITMIDAHI